MLCGSLQVPSDMRGVPDGLDFREGSSRAPGEFVIEKAFVEQ